MPDATLHAARRIGAALLHPKFDTDESIDEFAGGLVDLIATLVATTNSIDVSAFERDVVSGEEHDRMQRGFVAELATNRRALREQIARADTLDAQVEALQSKVALFREALDA